jgi:bacteriocin-like protein
MSNNNISKLTKNDSKGYVTELNDSELNEIQGGKLVSQLTQLERLRRLKQLSQLNQVGQSRRAVDKGH